MPSNYAITFDRELKLNPASWFEDELPAEQEALLIELADNPDPLTLTESMLLDGQTCWSHPGWSRDLRIVFEQWAHEGHLIKVRLVADWLLSTLPSDPLDSGIRAYLVSLSGGDFCDAFSHSACKWPTSPEFYRCSLTWPMVELAEDAEADLRATVRTRLALARVPG